MYCFKQVAVRILNLDAVASDQMASFVDQLSRGEERIVSCVIHRGFKIRQRSALEIRSLDLVQQVE